MRNEVVVEGTLARDPVERVLGSGEELWQLQVMVPRVSGPGADWIECSVREGRLRRTVARWSEGDLVRIEGHLRRRFFRTAGATRSVLEVNASAGRLVRRRADA
ncbi:single-stranded DNA-binding protein [Nocardioides daejeonensis]|uniref:single-stranded DNA-binding protein n=1 Tax=Nocardioides daejeonensis TaxID=1046556 RepID=UPI000D750B39|nr:single-stranded DNA-binding protein [Nocardioides daejeonensis]